MVQSMRNFILVQRDDRFYFLIRCMAKDVILMHEFISCRLHPHNVLGVRNFAEQFVCTSLVESANKYINKHFVDVSRSDEFLSLQYREVCELLQRDELHVSSEEQVGVPSPTSNITDSTTSLYIGTHIPFNKKPNFYTPNRGPIPPYIVDFQTNTDSLLINSLLYIRHLLRMKIEPRKKY